MSQVGRVMRVTVNVEVKLRAALSQKGLCRWNGGPQDKLTLD